MRKRLPILLPPEGYLAYTTRYAHGGGSEERKTRGVFLHVWRVATPKYGVGERPWLPI